MKKFQFLALMGAAALTGASLFSCSNDEEAAEVNPNYNPQTNEVVTNFFFNVANGTQGTRAAATTVQAGGANFRGLNDAILLAYKSTSNNFVDATAAAADAAKRFDFPVLLASGAVDNSTISNRILELGLPLETNAMLFYGHAPKTSTDKPAEVGAINYVTTGNKADQFHFDLVPRVNGNVAKAQKTADYLCYIMTCIAKASATMGIADIQSSFASEDETSLAAKFGTGWNGTTMEVTVSWKDLGANYAKNVNTDPSDDVALTPLEEILGSLYYNFTSESAEEYRAGSGSAILYMASDIYAALDAIAYTTATSVEELLAKEVANQISNRITNFFSNDTALTGYIAPASAKTNALSYKVNGIATDAQWTAAFDGVAVGDLADFPVTTFNLPHGAAIVAYDTTDEKFYNDVSKRVTDKTKAISIDKYMYPSELMYRCNSWIRTSNTEKKTNNYPNGVADWDTDSWTTWGTDWSAAKSKVTSSTRAAALGQNINYGVAMLQSNLEVAAGVTTYEDNNHKFHPTEVNNEIAVGDLNITLTGILIGGQPAAANWEFLPNDAAFDHVIYDNSIAGNAAGAAAPTAVGTKVTNYTLVLDNYKDDTQENQIDEVRVALEFKNNGDSFWGRDNMVRKGGTFYLIGKLPLKNAGTVQTLAASAWDSKYQVPPMDASGVSKKITRIFIQDYITEATFKLNELSLQGAYVTVPDLRSAQLSFGLSVDINWRRGLKFDSIELGGKN